MDSRFFKPALAAASIVSVSYLVTGCVPPEPLVIETPVNTVKAGEPLRLYYRLNSPLAAEKKITAYGNEYLRRQLSYGSDDILQNIHNSDPLVIITNPCGDRSNFDCWAREYRSYITVTPIANTRYTINITDKFINGLSGDIVDVIYSSGPNKNETYTAHLDVEVDRNIPVSNLKRLSTNRLFRLPSGPLRDCIAATGQAMTGQITGDFHCHIDNIEGAQFLYNVDSLSLTSSVNLSLSYLEYLDTVPLIDISGTATSCVDQLSLRDTMSATTEVVVNGSCL